MSAGNRRWGKPECFSVLTAGVKAALTESSFKVAPVAYAVRAGEV